MSVPPLPPPLSPGGSRKAPSYNSPISSILHVPTFNRGTGFTIDERKQLHIHGLLPPRVESLEIQLKRAWKQLNEFRTPLEKYIYLSSLQQRNETLFYKLITQNLEATMPLIYTPTVGEACVKFDQIYRAAQGLYFAINDQESVESIVDNWPQTPDIIVVTDGSRILGLGDLGTNGIGISIGKLALYVAGAGFHPVKTLPIVLDVGTNNERLLADEFYLGNRHKRVRGAEFYSFTDRFLNAVTKKWPDVLVQFEDFSNDVCFELLERNRNKFLCFNDDIQGTGAVILAGFINAVKVTGIPVKDHRLVFLGAGSAGIGVADQIVEWMVEQGLTPEEARARFWFVDSKGLVSARRKEKLEVHKIPYARADVDVELTTLLDVVKHVKPTGLIGLATIGGAFNEEIVKEVFKHTARPIIFPLSNPTANAECTAEQAYNWTDGQCVFASGSPFGNVQYKGRTLYPGQGNNMYIFPGLGLGAVVSKSRHVSQKMVLTSAKTLAACATEEDFAQGRMYPPLANIRDISVKIASEVANIAVQDGLSKFKGPVPATAEEWVPIVRDFMYEPSYLPFERSSL